MFLISDIFHYSVAGTPTPLGSKISAPVHSLIYILSSNILVVLPAIKFSPLLRVSLCLSPLDLIEMVPPPTVYKLWFISPIFSLHLWDHLPNLSILPIQALSLMSMDTF